MTIEIKEKCIICDSTLDMKSYFWNRMECTNCFNKQCEIWLEELKK